MDENELIDSFDLFKIDSDHTYKKKDYKSKIDHIFLPKKLQTRNQRLQHTN